MDNPVISEVAKDVDYLSSTTNEENELISEEVIKDADPVVDSTEIMKHSNCLDDTLDKPLNECELEQMNEPAVNDTVLSQNETDGVHEETSPSSVNSTDKEESAGALSADPVCDSTQLTSESTESVLEAENPESDIAHENVEADTKDDEETVTQDSVEAVTEDNVESVTQDNVEAVSEENVEAVTEENTDAAKCVESNKEDATEVDSVQEDSGDKSDASKVNEIQSDSPAVNEAPKEVDKQSSPQSNGNVDQEADDSIRENPIFEHVNTEKEGNSKTVNEENEQTQDEEEFEKGQPQEDPIAADSVEIDLQVEKDGIEGSEEQGADEELCIIPDTERVISQEEKDAARVLPPIRDPTEPDVQNNTESVLGVEKSTSATTEESDKFTLANCTDEALHSCIQCLLARKCKYTSSSDQRTLYICDDNCLNSFKEENPGKVSAAKTGDLRVKNLTPVVNSAPSVTVNFIRKCVGCQKRIENEEANLSWETMDFCNEFCLSKYQKKIGSNCSNCSVEVRANCLGKYCVRFGYDIRQFCSSTCLEEYKKGLKVCSYCQKDISGGGDGFLAPIGDKGQFKDFCTPQCMEKYDVMSNHRKPVLKPGVTCSVCNNEKPISIEYEHDGKMNLFCGEPCFVAFKFVNNIVPGKCDMCRRFFDNKVLEENTMYYDDSQHSFCSRSCQNIYIIANRRIVPCSWCKVKKYNFDMIRRFCSSGQVLMMCSLNCLSLYQVSVNAVNFKKTKCDHCLKSLQPMYHLTMSDATIRNFCSYACVMSFQSQFSKTPITLANDKGGTPSPVPTGAPKRSRRNSGKNSEPDVLTMPVISNVQSLAPTTNGSINTRATRSKAAPSPQQNAPAQPVKTQITQQVIVKPTLPPPQRNMATMCRVIQSTKATSIHPTMVNKDVQTDEETSKTILIPVPVPIYVPSPLPMYSLPFPVPVPFPLPIPVPIFIPTTRNSANGIMKEIKKIQVKIPTDPFEAELLMMAEMVADDKKEENTESESDEDDTAAPPADEPSSFSPEPADASNTFGDDMLQMALKMATELDEPAVDLEGALTANTITAPQGAEGTNTEESVDDPQPIHMMERQSFRGRKRSMRNSKQTSVSKRGRRMSSAVDTPLMAPPQPPTPQEPMEKPDANMCLKYTFGVNAWKQWVTTKNAELEKSSRRAKLFKPEILQLTADELNYSLCLFVKEVRKPNGTEYAPDTIYYLCLGIQQYLFENGRIDNIFCDAYYEKFTDCLDEVARKFSVLYNDSHYIVTRVEEEHLWESKQLGAHSPHVLLSTLMFFNTKHFNLTSVDEHMQLSFSHIMKHWKRNPNQPGTAKTPGSRNVLLRFYPPQSSLENNTRKKKVYEQQENEENPLRCPVKLYEFYLSKCPESVKTRNDVFYLQPERSCVPDSPVWYSTMPLGRDALEKMLHRVKMVKEINVALLTS